MSPWKWEKLQKRDLKRIHPVQIGDLVLAQTAINYTKHKSDTHFNEWISTIILKLWDYLKYVLACYPHFKYNY